MALVAVERTAHVCESLLCGTPLLLTPSTNGHLEWDDIERHRAAFAALARTLAEEQQALVLKHTAKKHKSNSVHLPSAYYILLPCESISGSLLIKV